MFDFQCFYNKMAFIDDHNHYVLYSDIYRVSKEILERIGSRNLVYLICDNTLGALVYYAALLHTDNIVQLVARDSRDDWKKKYLDSFQPHYLCVPIDHRSNHIGVHSFMDYCILRRECPISYDIHHNLTLLIASSGSTGECKFVRQSNANLVSNTNSIIKYLELTDNDRPILSLPMSYTYGLSVINTHLSVGATILISKKKIIQQEYWNFFNNYKGTSISGVPYSYELLYRFGFLNMELPYLNCMTQAGGRLSDGMIWKYNLYAKKHNIRFFIMYGQTEATARMSYLPYQYAWKNEKIGSIGIAIPDTIIYIEDEEGNEIRQSHYEGEIIFKGENVTMGYANSFQDLNKGNDNKGVLRTGDIAYYDDEHFLYISGRKKRFVKICGKRFNLDSIETDICEEYNIGCAVVGNDKMIYVVIDNLKACDAIYNSLLQAYSLHRNYLKVCYIPQIPKTVSGKKRYASIMEIVNSS